MKNILYITVQNPFSATTGGEQRSNLICQALSEYANIDIVCLSQDEIPPQNNNMGRCSLIYFENIRKSISPPSTLIQKFRNGLQRISRISSVYFITPRVTGFSSVIDEITQKKDYDYIFVRYIDTALRCGIKLNNKVLIDVDDLPEQVFLSLSNHSTNIVTRLFYLFSYKVTKIHTKRILKKIGHSFLPNKEQCIYPNSSYLPNIPFPTRENTSQVYKEEPYTVLFVGYMTYAPNYEGVDSFIENVWVDVVKELPNAKFRIAGKGLSTDLKLKWENINGVEVIGFIPDITSEYKKSSIVISPIYRGTGTNIKVVEAMYMSKACIITKQAARGFEDLLVDGENILIAINNKEFREKLIMLLTSPEKCSFIGKSAKNAVEKTHSYEIFSKSINEYIL